MKNMHIFIIGALFLFIVGACSKESYPAIEDKGSLAISVNIKDMTVSFINIEAGKKIAQWEMKKPYIGGVLLSDKDTLLLFGKQTEYADLFSLSEGEKIGSWKTGHGIVSGLLLENRKEVAFADQSTNSIRFFSESGTEIGSVRTENAPLTLLSDQNSSRLYVISYQSNSLSIIDINKMEMASNYQIHPSATGGLLLEEEGEIWIGGHGEGARLETNIHVYDADTGELAKKIHAPSMPISFAVKGENVFSLSHGSNMLYKFSRSGELIDSIKIAANPFEIKCFDGKLFVAGYDSDDVHIVHPDTLETAAKIQVGKGPFQLIFRERLPK